MINLVLNDLSSPAFEGFDTGLEQLVLVLDLDLLKAFGLSWTAQQTQTAFFRFIFSGLFEDHGVEHNAVSSPIIKGDDALADTDHIGRHTHTGFPMGL